MKPEKLFIRVFIALILFFIVLLGLGSRGLVHPTLILFTGWISFLARVLPQVTMNWSGIGMVVLCSGLILAAMHSLCQWLYAHWVRQSSPDTPARWRWTWTASLYGGLWLLFLAAMGVTGVVHQVGWLATSKEPLYVERYRFSAARAYLQQAALNLTMAGDQTEWKTAEVRRLFAEAEPPGSRVPRAFEDLHTLYLEKAPDEVEAVILFYRDPKKWERAGLVLISPNQPTEHLEMKQLKSVLARYQH